MKTMNVKKIDAVVVGGIGRRAISGLNEMGIKIYQSTEETVSKLVVNYKRMSLKS